MTIPALNAGGLSRLQTKAATSAGSSLLCYRVLAPPRLGRWVCRRWGAQLCAPKLEEGRGRISVTNPAGLGRSWVPVIFPKLGTTSPLCEEDTD